MPGARPSTLTIIRSALQRLGVIGAGQAASGEDTELALEVFNEIIGRFNTRRRKAYFMRFKSFTISTARTSYTIGHEDNSPTPNFTLTDAEGDRPVKIERAQIVFTDTTPDYFIEIPVFNWPEYAHLSMPGMTGQYPVAIYYAPETPNGIIYPYFSEPSQTANQIRLWWWNQFLTVDIADISTQLNLPPGLELALKLELAVALWPMFPRDTNLEELKRQARVALNDYQSPNVPPPNMSSTDGVHTDFYGGWDYRTRDWL